MRVGYGRTSTSDQKAGLEAQERDLKAAGCERIYAEHVSSVAAARPKLEEALRFVRAGDTLTVTKPCRLARNTRELLALAQDLKKREVGLLILSMGGQQIDTSSATGELLLTLLGGIAQFERANMLERQKEGVAKAKAEGKYKGRAPTVAKQAEKIRAMHAAGEKPAHIAKKLGIARSGVYRMLDLERTAESAS